MNRLSAANRVAGATEDRSCAYDDAGNMVYYSGLCAANPNMTYPYANGGAAGQGMSSGQPHAPSLICNGTSVSYDANGDTLAYDPDGAAGPLFARSLIYDGENLPAPRLGSARSALTSIRRIDVPERCSVASRPGASLRLGAFTVQISPPD